MKIFKILVFLEALVELIIAILKLLLIALVKVLYWCLIKPLLFLFNILVVNVFNLFYEGKGERIKHGKLQTALICYQHPETKKRVAILGTFHDGARMSYYFTLKKLIDFFEEKKFKVTYEHVFDDTPKEDFLENLDDSEEANIFDVVDYKDSWLNADFTASQIERRLVHLGCVNGSNNWIVGLVYGFPISEKTLVLQNFVIKFVALFSKQLRIFNGVLEHDRNKLAVRGIMQCLQNNNSALAIWGAAHLSGIDNILKSKGFEETKRFWHTAT